MPNSKLTLTLIGGPTVLIEYGSIRLLTDPTFDSPGIYQFPTMTVEKTTAPAIEAAAIGKIDAVLLSHEHHVDNLDAAGRALLDRVGKTFTTRASAKRLAKRAIGLRPFETCFVEGPHGDRLFVTATPARPGPIGIEDISGATVGFALGRNRPGDLLYVSGDTVWFNGVSEVADSFTPKVVVLFTGAARRRGGFRMTMGCEDVIEAIHAFPHAALVGAHSEGWTHLSESETQLNDVLDSFNLTHRFQPLVKGQARTFNVSV